MYDKKELKQSLFEKEEAVVEEPKFTIPRTYLPTIPFPSRITKTTVDKKFDKLLEVFRKVHVNTPLVQDLQSMPTYLESLKEVFFNKKKKWADYEKVEFPESCNAIMQNRMPAKRKDPGSFNISCIIGDDWQAKALCDLGASINLMPLSFFRKLKFGTLKPTTMTLQMADGSVKHLNGIIEDVLVKVNKFIFPVDFVVLDMQENTDVPLILGRPFLATSKAMIDVAQGELTLRMGRKRHIISIYNAMKKPTDGELDVKRKCKVVHMVAKIGVVQNKEPDGSDTNIPRWLFNSDTDDPKKQGKVVNPPSQSWKKRIIMRFLAKGKRKKDINMATQKGTS